MKEEVTFEPGQELSLEREGSPVKTILRGWKKGHYLLVDMPSGPWSTQDRSPIIGRLFGRGNYTGFTTKFMGFLLEFKLMVLKYPEDIIDNSYRKSARFKTALPVTILFEKEDGPRQAQCVIDNISAGGCQFCCGEEINLGDSLTLSLSLPTGSRLDRLGCVVKAINRADNRVKYGVEFDVVDEDELAPVKEFIERMSAFS